MMPIPTACTPNNWGSEHYVIKGVDASHRLMLDGPFASARADTVRAGTQVVENIFDELDAPGEWYFEPRRGRRIGVPRPGPLRALPKKRCGTAPRSKNRIGLDEQSESVTSPDLQRCLRACAPAGPGDLDRAQVADFAEATRPNGTPSVSLATITRSPPGTSMGPA